MAATGCLEAKAGFTPLPVLRAFVQEAGSRLKILEAQVSERAKAAA